MYKGTPLATYNIAQSSWLSLHQAVSARKESPPDRLVEESQSQARCFAIVKEPPAARFAGIRGGVGGGFLVSLASPRPAGHCHAAAFG